jgi:hypothetical protein
MTKKGLSLEQKREKVLEIFHLSDDVYQLKEGSCKEGRDATKCQRGRAIPCGRRFGPSGTNLLAEYIMLVFLNGMQSPHDHPQPPSWHHVARK